MNEAAYIVANQGMSDFLENTLGVDNPSLRVNLMKGGIRDVILFLRKPKEFVHSMTMRLSLIHI